MAIADQELVFTFRLDQIDATLHVVRFEGHEAISQLFSFDITLVSPTADIDLDAALRSTAVFTLRSRDRQQDATYRGMLAQFEQSGQVDGDCFYRATLVPRLWRAGLNRLNEVYLDEQTIPQAVLPLLKRNGLRGPDVDLRLHDEASYRARSFLCQYQESDLNVVSRWLEREGLYYIFDHETSHAGEVLCIMDHQGAQPADALKLRYTPPENVQTNRQDHCITAFTCRKTHLPGAALVQDFNYRQASLADDLWAETPIAGGAQGQHSRQMTFGMNLRTQDEARHLAQVRAEALAVQGTTFVGQAPATGVRSGHFVEIDNHFRADFNARYLVTEVSHRGSQAGVVLAGHDAGGTQAERGSIYECEFQAIAADLQYRPPLRTHRPTIAGVLSAVIDAEGDAGPAQLNEYGQYKVQLAYDYSGHAASKGSSWLRAATPYAGDREGMHFPLRKGTEVLLAFNDGDPDQPVIIGAVPNSQGQSVVQARNRSVYGFRTQEGNLMGAVDKPGGEAVGIYTPAADTFLHFGTLSATPSDEDAPPAADDPADVLGSLE